jgi:phosphoserine aminotransferase
MTCMNRQPAKEMLDWHGSGMSVMEMTHRGAVYLGRSSKDCRE